MNDIALELMPSRQQTFVVTATSTDSTIGYVRYCPKTGFFIARNLGGQFEAADVRRYSRLEQAVAWLENCQPRHTQEAA